MDGKKLGAAAIIYNHQGHVLLVKQSYDHLHWDLPGGAAEPGESIVETAVREVREETGLRVAPERTTGVYYDVEADFLHFVFVCRTLNEAAPFQPDAEVSECAYWPPQALPRPISDFTVRRINDAAGGQSWLLPVNIARRRWLE